jgi:hypothetical protein
MRACPARWCVQRERRSPSSSSASRGQLLTQQRELVARSVSWVLGRSQEKIMDRKLLLTLIASAGLSLASAAVALADDTTTGTDPSTTTDTTGSTPSDPQPEAPPPDSGDGTQK